MRRPSRRRVAIAAAGVAVALGVGYGIVLAVPLDQTPRRADVVLVLGPATDPRIAAAEALVEDGLAGALMVSTTLPDHLAPVDTGWAKPPMPGWILADGSLARSVAICADPSAAQDRLGVPVVCDQPEPFTTQGEARDLAATMTAHGWTSAIVLTVTPHVARTRLLIGRCTGEPVQVIGVDDELAVPTAWLWYAGYQVGGFAKAFATPGC